MLYLLRFAAQASHFAFSSQNALDIINRQPDIGTPWLALAAACAIGVTLNLSLAVFNMLPIPPFDGGFIAQNLFPPLAPIYDAIRPFSFMFLFLIIQAGPLLDPILRPVDHLGAGLVLQGLGHDPHDYTYGG